MSDLTKQSELKELALKIDALRKRRDDMLRSNNWIQNNQDEYILELDTQWPTISNALRSSASAGVREALEECKHWHERHDKALSKSGRGDADYYWRRDQHRQEIERIDTILSALTRPLGGFVQGSVATKRSSDPEGSSRTETAIATMLCKSGKFETGEGTCAFVCMGRLGDVRKDGCSHAKRVHAKLAATIAEGLRAECGYDHGYADGVEWATCHAAVAETNAAASGNTSLVSGASSAPFPTRKDERA